MSSAAAQRFAARYGLGGLFPKPPSDNECPTRPTTSDTLWAPPEPEKPAEIRHFSTPRPTCPTHFAEVDRQLAYSEFGIGGAPPDIADKQALLGPAHAPSSSQSIVRSSLDLWRQEADHPARPEVDLPARLVPVDPWAVGVAELQHMSPPQGFSDQAWALVQRGCGSLFGDWGAMMRSLGWSVGDAFGVHPDVPATAAYCRGLGVILGNARVTDMLRDNAIIALPNGVRQSFARYPRKFVVPVWTIGRLT